MNSASRNSYDTIVIGTGGIGSATLFQLANRGNRVLGIDRFPAAHDRGSSHGQTRVIRQAYFEHPDYVPLLLQAYRSWEQLEHLSETKLYFEVGLLEAGPRDGILAPGVLNSARQHGLQVEELTDREARSRFPGYRLSDGWQIMFEHQAGYLLVETCVRTHLEQAQRLGAELLFGQTVRGWQAVRGEIRVEMDNGVLSAGRLIITAGAWATQLLSDLDIPLRVLRKHLHWYANQNPGYHATNGAPVFFFEVPFGFIYGFPQIDSRGVKVAEHSGGELVADPLNVDRRVDMQDRRRVESFLRSHLPLVSNDHTDHSVCMYTMTPDDHFLVDRHPEFENVCFAAGLSGHGFKFAPVLARALADLALDGKTNVPIDFLRLARIR